MRRGVAGKRERGREGERSVYKHAAAKEKRDAEAANQSGEKEKERKDEEEEEGRRMMGSDTETELIEIFVEPNVFDGREDDADVGGVGGNGGMCEEFAV